MTVILVDRQDASTVEEEEKIKWALYVLEDMGVPMEDWPTERNMDNLRRIRSILKKSGVDVIDDTDNGLKIYFENKLMAQWIKPSYVLREDPRERDVTKRYYLEMHLNCEVLYKQQENQ